MKLDFCVACGAKHDLHHHHLKPRIAGGTNDETNLVTLCQECHAIYHNLNFRDHGHLTRLGLEQAKARGVKLGSPKAQEQGILAKKQSEELLPILDQLIVEDNRSLYSLSKALNERGLKTPKGSKFYPNTVCRHFKYLGYTLSDYLEQHHPCPTNGSKN